jgi:hypothetical protein
MDATLIKTSDVNVRVTLDGDKIVEMVLLSPLNKVEKPEQQSSRSQENQFPLTRFGFLEDA